MTRRNPEWRFQTVPHRSTVETRRAFLDKLQSIWDNVLWTDESTVDSVHSFLFIADEFKFIRGEKNTVITRIHGGWSIMLWGCFADSGVRGIEEFPFCGTKVMLSVFWMYR